MGLVHHCVVGTGLRSRAGTPFAVPGKCIPSRPGLMRWPASVEGTSWMSRAVQQESIVCVEIIDIVCQQQLLGRAQSCILFWQDRTIVELETPKFGSLL